MFRLCVLILALIAKDCFTQEDDDGPYRGKLIGKLNSYHHQVSGDVYAVDDWTFLLVDFNYDGTGDDTFFWAGDSGRPGPQGFIVPDQLGKTNILERYYNAEVRLSLPEGKRISRLKWLAVFDIASQNTFGDVFVAEEFEAPAPRGAGALAGSPAVSSANVQLLDAATILIPEFRYDGSGGEVYFWTGVGPQPSARGAKVPDEYGYLEPIRAYSREDVRLELPGGRTVFQVDWLAVWDAAARASLGSVLLPDAPNVPPAPRAAHAHKSALPNCKQLHRDYQVAWEVFGNQVTFQLAAQILEDEYMAFGISGSTTASRMLGADVAVAQFDPRLQRGLATDYNISAIAPCVQVLGQWQGVCPDERVGGQDSNQVFSASRDDGVTLVTYRRTLQPGEGMDREWSTSGPTAVVWALGALDAERAPAFHARYHRQDLALTLAADPPTNDCFPFAVGSRAAPPPWEVAELFDPALRVFTFRLGAGRQRPALGHGVPPAGGDGHAARRPGARYRRRAARRARAGRRAPVPPRPPHAHRRGAAVRGAARRGRGPAPRRRLRDLPRLQPLPRVGLPARRPRRAAPVAQRHLARHRLLPLLHARRHGRAHLRGGPPQAQHRPRQAGRRRRLRAGRRRRPRAAAAAASAAGAELPALTRTQHSALGDPAEPHN